MITLYHLRATTCSSAICARVTPQMPLAVLAAPQGAMGRMVAALPALCKGPQ